jgi:hypothetical protein
MRTFLVFALIAGCTAETSPRLDGVIGAAGGTLAGSSGSPFEGFALVIAPGALDSDTQITVEQSFDQTPLPLGADPCGPMFAITPQDLPLLVPARVQLPVSPNRARLLGHRDDDVQVWGRDGEGWQKLDPTAATASSVEVAVTTLSTFGAGVKVSAVPLICGPFGCSLPPEFSVTSAGVAPYRNDSDFIALDTRAVYYGSTDAFGRGMGVRYDLTTQATSTSLFNQLGGGVLYGPDIAVDAKGNFWAPTNLGNVMFPFSGASPVSYKEKAYGTVITTGGALVRLSVTTFSVLAPGGFFSSLFTPADDSLQTELGFPADPASAEPMARRDPSVPDAFWIAMTTTVDEQLVRRYSVTTHVTDKEVSLAGEGAFSVAPDGTIANVHQTHLPGTKLDPTPPDFAEIIPPTGSRRTLQIPQSSGVPIHDATGALWVMSSATPQIFVVRTDDSVETIPLTSTTDPNSTDYLARVPFAMQTREDGAFVVMTHSREILIIRRN